MSRRFCARIPRKKSMSTKCLPSVYQVSTKCLPSVYRLVDMSTCLPRSTLFFVYQCLPWTIGRQPSSGPSMSRSVLWTKKRKEGRGHGHPRGREERSNGPEVLAFSRSRTRVVAAPPFFLTHTRTPRHCCRCCCCCWWWCGACACVRVCARPPAHTRLRGCCCCCCATLLLRCRRHVCVRPHFVSGKRGGRRGTHNAMEFLPATHTRARTQ
jgi:hypothetical protein